MITSQRKQLWNDKRMKEKSARPVVTLHGLLDRSGLAGRSGDDNQSKLLSPNKLGELRNAEPYPEVTCAAAGDMISGTAEIYPNKLQNIVFVHAVRGLEDVARHPRTSFSNFLCRQAGMQPASQSAEGKDGIVLRE